jgi:tripartite-type tricarboxylate transporter receptor subunit TctC
MSQARTMNAMIVAALLALPATARAESWPVRPLTMVVPYAAGGSVDAIGRILAPRLGEIVGQQVVVENIGGAGGMMGANRVAKAAPDGYVFLLGGIGTLAFNQTLYRKPLYNAATDFAHVALVTDSPRVLVVRKDLPANSMAEFIAYAKANQARMQYGSAGAGSGSHVCAVLLDSAIGTKITHVPYRGVGPAVQELVGGRIDFVCEQISTVVPQVQGGTVKALAILGRDRVSVLADVPAAPELGLGDLDCNAWAAFVLPKATPEPIIRHLAQAADETVTTASVRARLETIGVTIPPRERRTSNYLAKFVPDEIEKWGRAIRASSVIMD